MRASRLFLGMIAIYAIISIAGATTYLQVQSPVNGTIYDGGSVFLGKVGPGESFSVIASATTTNASGGRLVNLGWNTFEAVNMPQGWIAQNSPLYENPMLLKITTPPYATNGTYRLTLRAVNIQNYSRLGNLTFTALVNVSTNVFTLNVTPTQFNIGTGQPQNLRIVINNTGISDDPFVINAAGLAGWNISDSVVALHSLKSTFTYPIFVGVPGQYNFNLTVASTTSTLVSKSVPISMLAQASLLNDYSAIGQGVVLSPLLYEPTYAVMETIRYILTYFGM